MSSPYLYPNPYPQYPQQGVNRLPGSLNPLAPGNLQGVGNTYPGQQGAYAPTMAAASTLTTPTTAQNQGFPQNTNPMAMPYSQFQPQQQPYGYPASPQSASPSTQPKSPVGTTPTNKPANKRDDEDTFEKPAEPLDPETEKYISDALASIDNKVREVARRNPDQAVRSLEIIQGLDSPEDRQALLTDPNSPPNDFMRRLYDHKIMRWAGPVIRPMIRGIGRMVIVFMPEDLKSDAKNVVRWMSSKPPESDGPSMSAREYFTSRDDGFSAAIKKDKDKDTDSDLSDDDTRSSESKSQRDGGNSRNDGPPNTYPSQAYPQQYPNYPNPNYPGYPAYQNPYPGTAQAGFPNNQGYPQNYPDNSYPSAGYPAASIPYPGYPAQGQNTQYPSNPATTPGYPQQSSPDTYPAERQRPDETSTESSPSAPAERERPEVSTEKHHPSSRETERDTERHDRAEEDDFGPDSARKKPSTSSKPKSTDPLSDDESLDSSDTDGKSDLAEKAGKATDKLSRIKNRIQDEWSSSAP